MVVRDKFIADPRIDCAIGATPEPTPAVVRVRIFRVDDEVNGASIARDGTRNAKVNFAIEFDYVEGLG